LKKEQSIHSLSCLTFISNCVILRNSVLFPSNIYSALVFFTQGWNWLPKGILRLKCCFEHINAAPVCAPPPTKEGCAISNRKGTHCLPLKMCAPSPIKKFVRLLPPKRDAPSLTEEGYVIFNRKGVCHLPPKMGCAFSHQKGTRHSLPPKSDAPSPTKEGCAHLPPKLW
jgi:hypothetical protein